jgi:hypothetical protein
MLALPATSQSLLPLAKRLPGNLTRLQAEGMDGQGLPISVNVRYQRCISVMHSDFSQ